MIGKEKRGFDIEKKKLKIAPKKKHTHTFKQNLNIGCINN